MAGKKYRAEDLRRFAKAKERRDKWDSILTDTYRLVLPDVDVGGSRSEGSKNDTELFEGQGARSLSVRANRMVGQLFPPFSKFVSFEFQGVKLARLPEDIRDGAKAYLHEVAEVVHEAITESNFFIEIPTALKDVLVSTGCIVVNPGHPDDTPLVFEALPPSQVVPEEGPRGTLETVFRPRKVARRNVAALWPDAKLAAVKDWPKKLEKDPDDEIEVLECQLHDPQKASYQYKVYLLDGEHEIYSVPLTSPRMIAFRMDKATGDLLGRGPAITCRADLKTANVTKGLTLKNASIAVTGIWQADDDGVLNPANIKLVPGTIIPKAVGSAGLQPLQSPGRFDVSQIIMADQTKAVKDTIEGAPLPGFDQDRPVAYAFMSAERQRAETEVPEHTRLFYELDMRLWRSVVDILSSEAFKGSRWYIPPVYEAKGGGADLKLRPKPENPLVRLQRMAEWNSQLEGIARAGTLFGPDVVAAEVKIPQVAREYLSDGIGLPPELLYSTAEKQEEAKRQKQLQQAYAAGMQQGVAMAAQMSKTDAGTQLLGQAGQMVEGADAAA